MNGGDQSVTIDLPGLLHSGSSVTTDEHPYIKIDIPSPTPEEQDGANPPLGGVHATLAVDMPKTPSKPRVTLMAEVGDLLTRGMTEDYDHEPEHSAMVKELATKTDTFPPPKREVPALPLDTSSQVSVPEMEASMESNPVCDSPTAVAYSSHSDSPTMDLPELQANAHLAINHMLSIKRSLDLERQWVIWDFETLLHQREAEAATANERAKVVHLRKDLQARVKCTKVVMRAKYDYRVAIQEARAIRCSKLEEVEAPYSEALSENAAAKSLQCAALHREHAKYMHQLEERAWRWKTKASKTSFLPIKPSYAMLLSPSRGSTFLLPHLIRTIVITSIHFICQGTPGTGATTCNYSSQARTQMVSTGLHTLQEGLSSSKRGKTTDWSSSLQPSHADVFSQDSSPMREARECYFATHPWDWAHSNTDDLSDIFRELAQGAGLLGESIHEIQLAWNGPEDLKHANYVLQSLTKGLKFLRVVSTKESPKIMGLKGIHNSNALWHFASYTYCLWCSKDGQNEGTVINHLRTVHYKLGLICNQCFGCPTVMLDTLH